MKKVVLAMAALLTISLSACSQSNKKKNKEMKKTITTIMLALVAMTGWAQTKVFTPEKSDTIDFVITGKTATTVESVRLFTVAPIRGNELKAKLAEIFSE